MSSTPPEDQILEFLYKRYGVMMTDLHGILQTGTVRAFAFAVVTEGETTGINFVVSDVTSAARLHEAMITIAGTLETRYAVQPEAAGDTEEPDLEAIEAPSNALN